MPPQTLAHRRTHNLLLVSKLLNLRDNASPFTLLLDSLAQSARGVVGEYIRRANIAKCTVIFVSFETPKAPGGVDRFIKALRKPLPELQKEVTSATSTSPSSRTLLIIDSLNHLSSTHPSSLSIFLSSLISPSTTLLSTFHLDVPLTPTDNSYPESAPDPLVLLKYLCTTLITVHSITHTLEKKRRRDRSLPPPVWGPEEGIDGVIVGFGSNSPSGVVLEMEYRRKSGRGVVEWFYLPLDEKRPGNGGVREKEKVILLEDHPQWRVSEQVKGQEEHVSEDEMPKSTFELGITDRQKKARDEVVLPYFDAQREGGGGGGAILFTPEKEVDDFDEEEDEF